MPSLYVTKQLEIFFFFSRYIMVNFWVGDRQHGILVARDFSQVCIFYGAANEGVIILERIASIQRTLVICNDSGDGEISLLNPLLILVT